MTDREDLEQKQITEELIEEEKEEGTVAELPIPSAVDSEEIEEEIINTPVNDPLAFVPEEKKKRRGRPKGSKNKPKTGAQEEEISQSSYYAQFWQGLSSMVSMFTREEKWVLNNQESQALGEASIPLVEKYGVAFFGEYLPEINFSVIFLGIIALRIRNDSNSRKEREGENLSNGENSKSSDKEVSLPSANGHLRSDSKSYKVPDRVI